MHRKRPARGGEPYSRVVCPRIMTCPRLFRPHENLSDEVNRNLVQSEIEGGVKLQDLEPGSMLRMHTENTCYEIVVLHGGLASALLPAAGAGDHRWLYVGWLNAQGALHRSRHAPRVSSSGISHTHCHLDYPRNPRMPENFGCPAGQASLD